jgi:GTP pyrophosphokinase
LKESQVIGKLKESQEKNAKRVEESDPDMLIAKYSENDPARQASQNHSAIIVRGIDDIDVHFGKCCSPVPGDEIVGFVTRGRGISIHRTDCINIINLPEIDKSRIIEATWNVNSADAEEFVYNTEIRIYSDKNGGIIYDTTRILSENQVNIQSITTRMAKNGISTTIVAFEIKGVRQLRTVIEKIRQIPGVVGVERTTG